MTKPKPLAQFLRTALDRAGVTQTGLAKALGVSRSTVYLWASGKREAPERFRSGLRNAARGFRITPPPPRVTKEGRPVRHRASVTRIPLTEGRHHVQTRARSALAAELAQLAATGHAPTTLTVVLEGFRATDSLVVRGRTRRVQIHNLSAREISALAGGSKQALEQVTTRGVQARSYSGGFTFDRATRFSFDTT